MITILLIAVCVLLLFAIYLIFTFKSNAGNHLSLVLNRIAELESDLARIESNLKQDFKINREENATIAKDNRKELNDTFLKSVMKEKPDILII